MTELPDRILKSLHAVERERAARALDETWRRRVQAIKTYQQRRFTRTYADLLESSRYGSAARFFLDHLYGPRDFTERDAQFVRIVPALVRLFPTEIVETVDTLASLHALSESLDSDMARRLACDEVTRERYVAAWRASGRADDRERQIALTLEVGRALDRYTRRPLVRQSLRMMRAPARAAGLSELQRFLESGFDSFAAMRGAADFLATVGTRERSLASALFGHQTELVALRTARWDNYHSLGRLTAATIAL